MPERVVSSIHELALGLNMTPDSQQLSAKLEEFRVYLLLEDLPEANPVTLIPGLTDGPG